MKLPYAFASIGSNSFKRANFRFILLSIHLAFIECTSHFIRSTYSTYISEKNILKGRRVTEIPFKMESKDFILLFGARKITPCVLLLILANRACGQQDNHPLSPCPYIFQYKFDGNEWYGVVQVPDSPFHKQRIELDVKLTLRATIKQNNIGSIRLLENGVDKQRLVNINTLPHKYRIQFPYRYPIPTVTQIIYDDQLICEGFDDLFDAGGGPVSRIELKHILNTHMDYGTKYNDHFGNQNKLFTRTEEIGMESDLNLENSQKDEINEICGKQHKQMQMIPLVYGGRSILRGNWPWLVAIYLNRPRGLKFNCGGSLISSKAVVTAAHCLQSAKRTYMIHEILIWLGRHNLMDWNEQDSISSNVQQILIHPDFKRTSEDSYDADLAILITSKHIEFNRFIRPVCLWSDSMDQTEFIQQNGTLIGWGRDNSDNILSDSPKMIELPTINYEECGERSKALRNAVSNRTFCAGTLNGNGPCQGDSGGGFMVYTQMGWTLKGVVSAGLTDPNSGECKLTDYVVFTDVLKFLPWIRTNI